MGYWRLRVAFPLKVAWLLEEPSCKAADCFVSHLLGKVVMHTQNQPEDPTFLKSLHTNPESAFLNQPRSCKSSRWLYVWKQMKWTQDWKVGVSFLLNQLSDLEGKKKTPKHFSQGWFPPWSHSLSLEALLLWGHLLLCKGWAGREGHLPRGRQVKALLEPE